MKKIILEVVFACSCLFYLQLSLYTSTASAQGRFLVNGDTDYFSVDVGDFRLIYSREYRPLVASFHNYNRVFKAIYEKEFNWFLDEKETIVFASPQNQIANGFATILPRLHTVFYSGTGDIIDELSVQSWLYTLLSHETAHLYQLNTKQGYSKLLKSIFGNSNINGFSFLPPFTYTMNPNIFLPTFILEGNATYNESRFGNGGRLYNGAIRGMLLQLIREEKVNADRLMNDHLDFPYTHEKYWVGGFLFLDIAEKLGADRVNHFFLEHANSNGNPMLLNEPFLKAFGFGYKEAITNLNKTWRPLANSVVKANEKPLFTSNEHAALTRDANEIRFLTATNKNLPVAHIYNRQSKTWTEKKVNMPVGRLFRSDSHNLVAVSSEPTGNNQIRSGLFGDGYSFDEKSLDKNYYDFADNNRSALWADAKNSLFSPNLKFHTHSPDETLSLGFVASSGIIANSQSYFFRQNKKNRTLYRNNNPIFSYRGYYGYPVDVDNNEIYFIGPVERGSSLFVWSGERFSRLHPSDLIIDAKLIDNKTAIIVEFTTQGYEYKIVNLERQDESPFEYKYFFENDILFKTYDDLHAPGTENHTIPNEKPYKSLSEWQFDGIDPMIFFGIDTLAVAQATIRFSDPLQNHQLGLILGSGSFGEMTSGLKYENTKNVINWDLLGLYQRRAKVAENLSVKSDSSGRWQILDRYDVWTSALGFNYTFYRRPQWFSALNSHFVYEYENPKIAIDDTDQKYTLLTQFSLDYAISPQLAYQAYKTFSFNFDHEYIRTAPDWVDQRNIFGARAMGSFDLWRETYLSAKYQSVLTDGTKAIVPFQFGPDDFPYPTVTHVNRNTSYPDENFFALDKASIQLVQAINWGYYFARFPISLRRMAIVAEYNEYYGSTSHHTSAQTLFHEAGGGTEFELLLFHRFPLRTRLMQFKSSYKDETTTVITLGGEI